MGHIHKRVAKALGIERPRRSARVRLADGRRLGLGVDTAIVLEALGLVVDSRRAGWLHPGPTPSASAATADFPHVTIVRCPIHGIAFDAELEGCPEWAKG